MADIKVISATLLSGHNTVQITDSIISNDTIFEIYVSDPNIICNNIVVGGTTANITFDSKPTENVSIKVLLNNASGVLKVPSADITDGETTQSAINTSVADSIADINADITDLDNNKVDTSTLNDRVPSETVLGGVLYHGTTGNEWKVLTGSNVNYDSENTVNEKIDELEESIEHVSGVTFENDSDTSVSIAYPVTANTFTSSPTIATLPKGIYFITISFTAGSYNTNDRGYIRVGNTNNRNMYKYFQTVNSFPTSLSGIINCPEDTNNITLRCCFTTAQTVYINEISKVKIG